MVLQTPVKSERPQKWLEGGIYFALGTEVALCVIAGLFLGYGMDRWLRTSPLFTLVLALGGLAAGIYNLLRSFKHDDKSKDPNKPEVPSH